MAKRKNKNKECIEGKNGKCCLCKDYKNGECPGYYSTVTDSENNNLFSIPLLNEYREEYFKDLEAMAKKYDLITKYELLKQLEKEGIKLTSRRLTYYMDLGLIPKGIKTLIPGLPGSFSFFKKNVLLMITSIHLLVEYYKLTLQEISRYKDLVYNFNELELSKICIEPKEEDKYLKSLHNLERLKLENITMAYACAEVNYKPGLKIISVNNKIFMPVFYVKTEGNTIKEIHVKLADSNDYIVGQTAKKLKAYKEVIYSKKGTQIIG